MENKVTTRLFHAIRGNKGKGRPDIIDIEAPFKDFFDIIDTTEVKRKKLVQWLSFLVGVIPKDGIINIRLSREG